ncbi:MAG: hypothetical protein MJA27_09665 [Pseudanabaenales cyanobacterium]|nr:hypothetical protein [Pseudanabaenales cyanobacterium]
MFTLRADLLKALGIRYDTSSKFLVVRGRLYERGLSFSKQEHRQAARYYQKSNQEGSACLLIDSLTELTVWLEVSNSKLISARRGQQPQAVVSHKQPSQPSSKMNVHLSYRGA